MLRSPISKITTLVITIFLILLIQGPFRGRSIWPTTTDHKPTPNEETPPLLSVPKPSQKQIPKTPQIDHTNKDARFTRFTNGVVHWEPSIALSRKLHQGNDPIQDLSLLSKIFSKYRLIFKENPVGTDNFEFTAALLGNNPKKTFFIDPEHPSLNEQNQLLDRWGTPYRFHPLSATQLEIISSGPDKKLWTKDDLTYAK